VTDRHQKSVRNALENLIDAMPRLKRKSASRTLSDDDVTSERDLHRALRTLRLAWSVSLPKSGNSDSHRRRSRRSVMGSSDSTDSNKTLSTLCGNIIRLVRDTPHLSQHLADVAINGFRSAVVGGRRGCVLMTFDDVNDAQLFSSGGGNDCRQVFYIDVDELRGACCSSPVLLSEMESLCREYEPETRYIICIAIVDKSRTIGCVRGARLRLPEVPVPHFEDSTSQPRRIAD
jgi:hypothetical protein